MLPTNLTPLEVIDAAIHSEALAYKMYDRLSKCVEIPALQSRLAQLKKDERDHRKMLRAHRREIFGKKSSAMMEAQAVDIFGKVDLGQIVDKETLIRALYAMIRFEEYVAYFYDRQRHKIPNREVRLFFEVLASECKFHADILKRQIESIRPMRLELDERGRTVETLRT